MTGEQRKDLVVNVPSVFQGIQVGCLLMLISKQETKITIY